MMPNDLQRSLQELALTLKGDLYYDDSSLLIYSTDASVYREKPLAIARPKDKDDLVSLIHFAHNHDISLIPRAAGTSLAGQVVGQGIIVDISKYFTNILEINKEEKWVRVEPAVVLDELNQQLAPLGLFFGPETSTSNRCMISGMVGNNSCGAHSILYGSTRDHVLEIKGYLSDAAAEGQAREYTFKALSDAEFHDKCRQADFEGRLYRQMWEILSNPSTQEEIKREYPHPGIRRRNTGYALDLLLKSSVFDKKEDGNDNPEAFNFCKLLSGSEGTLCLMTEIRLNLVPLPPGNKSLVCIHCHTLEEAFKANLVALTFQPASVELIDRIIIECTRENIEQRKNRFFIKGEPEAILIVEFATDDPVEMTQKVSGMITAMQDAGYGYHYPVVTGSDINKIWALRKAGLGLLSNVPGDAKPVTLVEDTAVMPADLPEYMKEFRQILASHGKDCVYYAHIATGELHLKPVLNLKDPDDVRLFRVIGEEIARLVKKYRGSLSGEHGDGRLRGEFIPLMLGEGIYEILKSIKNTWDPRGIFNVGKITSTPPMDRFLRYEPGQKNSEPITYFDFSVTRGLLRAVEQCNGSGDCRKSERIGGTMCPSYMATRDENRTTRARANILREFLSQPSKNDPFDHKEIYEILDLCLSCKGCKSECPSNVDMAKYKAEFLQHWYDLHGSSLRSKIFANISQINRLGSRLPGFYNFLLTAPATAGFGKSLLGLAKNRSLPTVSKVSLSQWMKKVNHPEPTKGKVFLFSDEFTEYCDTSIGAKAVDLLEKLGYEIIIPHHVESGRAYISKGFLKKARKLAMQNLMLLKDIISEESPLIGIEPSAILTFRDEYPDLLGPDFREAATRLGRCAILIDDFIATEFDNGRIASTLFTIQSKQIHLHGHCQQKALISTSSTKKMLSIPVNYKVEEIKSGCCGMAGSFGYEKEHYELSMKVGELVLFPELRKADPGDIIAAPGTSCRTQIMDGTGKKAYHPVEILHDALV